jgi:alanine dehydrogenase
VLFLLQLANKGWKKACKENEELKKGLNVANGKIVYRGVADAWGLPFNEVESVWNEALATA